MSRRFKVVERIEHILLALGVVLLGIFAAARLHRFVMLRIEMAQFEAKRASTPVQAPAPPPRDMVDLTETSAPTTAAWSVHRAKAYAATLNNSIAPLAVLRISRLNLEVPVLDGTDEFTLNRGVGRIRNTAFPGEDGNIGIAGHRDGFFRSLKDIRMGDTIDLVMDSGTRVYIVDRVHITSPEEVGVLRARGKPRLTLVTCYPFYFVGPAPSRYIVEAALQQ